MSLNVFLPAEAAAVAGQVLATHLASLTTPWVSGSNCSASNLGSEGSQHDADPLGTLHHVLAGIMCVMHEGDEAGDDFKRLGSRLARRLCRNVFMSRYAPLNLGDKVGRGVVMQRWWG